MRIVATLVLVLVMVPALHGQPDRWRLYVTDTFTVDGRPADTPIRFLELYSDDNQTFKWLRQDENVKGGYMVFGDLLDLNRNDGRTYKGAVEQFGDEAGVGDFHVD
jgi:hypothetical protein